MQFRTLLTTASAAVLALGTMAGAAQADSNKLFMEQVNSANFAGATQEGNGNETYVSQTGNRSSAGAGFKGNNNDGLIVQESNNNRADWSFETAGGGGISGNTFGIVQKGGNENFAGINTQGAPTNSIIFIEQDGARNEVGGGTSFNTAVGNSNVTSANITTAGLTASFVGPVDSGVADLAGGNANLSRVEGDGHFIGLTQFGGNNNVVAMDVRGSGNTIAGANTGGPSTLNDRTATSFFDSPDALTPTAGGVSGLGEQQGFNNQAVLVQEGANNTINFAQIGNNNVSETYENGSGNLAVARQQ